MRDSVNVNGIGALTAPGKGDAPKFGHEMGDWEKKDIWNSNDRSSGCGVLVKTKRECGIRTPLSRPSIIVSGKLPTYPAHKPTFCPK